MFWQNDSSGINQRADFYSTIAKNVRVYRQDIGHISAHSVTLSATQDADSKEHTLPVDLLILCTGWSPVSELYPLHMAGKLGLPVSIEETGHENPWSDMEAAEETTDKFILDRFPLLRHPPAHRTSVPLHTPFRLYKAMTPLADHADHSIVFLGKMVVGNNFRVAEVQALWAVAYLDGQLELDKAKMERDVAETVAWCRRRYLNKGQLGSWFYFDVIDYTDMLLAQLGLKSHRRRGWLNDFFSTCKAADLKDLVKEYKAKYPS